MARTNRSSEPEDEVSRLQARVDELEARLSRKESRMEARGREVADSLRDTSERATDETSKLIRGLTLAYLEKIRSTMDVVISFVDGVTDRNRPEKDDTIRRLTSRLPGDMTDAFLDAVDQTLDVPNKTIDAFYRAYNESPAKSKPKTARKTDKKDESSAESTAEGKGAAGTESAS
jgi:uncharacterized protein YbcC (UPF0753/DUF2309 family)